VTRRQLAPDSLGLLALPRLWLLVMPQQLLLLSAGCW
jgi:hypothetical protein